MKTKTKAILIIAALLIAGRWYHNHEAEEKERQRIEALMRSLDSQAQTAAVQREMQEKEQDRMDALFHRRPALPPPPQPNPQLDALNQNLENINRSIRDADLHRAIEEAGRPLQ